MAEPDGAGVLQTTAYYPYGLQIADLGGGSSTNEELYNGKELTDAHGLNWYHYGARYYDVSVARWTSMDPADEFHSPYTYVGGDPVNLVDPDGRQVKNAEHWLGTPYGFLADGIGSDESPNSMDCKQLIYATYRDYGVDNFPETDMKLQTEWFKKHSEFTTDWSEGEAGDVVFVGTDGHVNTPQSRHNMIITDKRSLESGEVQYKFIHASSSQKKVVTQGWTSRSSVEDHWGITRGQFVGIGKSPGNIVLPGINLLMHSSQRDASNPGQSDPSMLGRMARAVSSFMDALSPRESLGPDME